MVNGKKKYYDRHIYDMFIYDIQHSNMVSVHLFDCVCAQNNHFVNSNTIESNHLLIIDTINELKITINYLSIISVLFYSSIRMKYFMTHLNSSHTCSLASNEYNNEVFNFITKMIKIGLSCHDYSQSSMIN